MCSREEVPGAFDRIGSFQDLQPLYENRAIEMLLHHGDFGAAESVFEFGFGTDRFAPRLFGERRRHPPEDGFARAPRPIGLLPFPSDSRWPIDHHARVVASVSPPKPRWHEVPRAP